MSREDRKACRTRERDFSSFYEGRRREPLDLRRDVRREIRRDFVADEFTHADGNVDEFRHRFGGKQNYADQSDRSSREFGQQQQQHQRNERDAINDDFEFNERNRKNRRVKPKHFWRHKPPQYSDSWTHEDFRHHPSASASASASTAAAAAAVLPSSSASASFSSSSSFPGAFQSSSSLSTAIPIENRILCKFWSSKGFCQNFPRCKYAHELRSLCHVRKAHSMGIYSICSAAVEAGEEERRIYNLQPGATLVNLYTASQDCSIKKWILYPEPVSDYSSIIQQGNFYYHDGASSSSSSSSSSSFSSPAAAAAAALPPPSPNQNSVPKLQLKLIETIELGSSCLTLYYGQDCLVCGMKSGDIKIIFHTPREHLTLKGHGSEVHSVQFIDRFLFSGDWAGRLIVWDLTDEFQIKTTLNIDSPITRLLEISLPPTVAETPSRFLWVGCAGGIKIVNLLSMSIVKVIQVDPLSHATNPPVVMSLLRADNHVLCCFLGLGVKVYDICNGDEVAGVVKNQLCSMAGSQSLSGPVILCGAPHGEIYVLNLPSLETRFHFKLYSRDVRSINNIGGNPSFFATGSMDGALDVWHWCSPDNSSSSTSSSSSSTTTATSV